MLKKTIALLIVIAAAILLLWSFQNPSTDKITVSNKVETEVTTPFAVETSPLQQLEPTNSQAVIPSETDVNSEPDGLSISGTVLSQEGEHISDIEIIATPRRVFSNAIKKEAAQHRTITDETGRFGFSELKPGDYRISSVATPLYPSSSVDVRAGGDAVILILKSLQDLWVYGVVQNTDREPLAGVRIVPNRDADNAQLSKPDGSFAFSHTLQNSQVRDNLSLSLNGYHEKQMVLKPNDPYASELALGNIKLEPIEGLSKVSGNVTANATPVADAGVYLRSTERSAGYQTTTDAAGFFTFPKVAVGSYEINVVPKMQFQDYTDYDLVVDKNNLKLNIALQKLNTSTLRGRMQDTEANAIPNFTLWVTSLSARKRGARPITGNALGEFEVQAIPSGELRFTTYSNPRLRITGETHNGPDKPPLELVLDVGKHQLSGQVVDSYANTVAGASVSLVWTHENNGVTSHAARNTTTDAQGRFRFSQLGPGEHILTVNASNYHRKQIKVQAPDEVVVELSSEIK